MPKRKQSCSFAAWDVTLPCCTRRGTKCFLNPRSVLLLDTARCSVDHPTASTALNIKNCRKVRSKSNSTAREQPPNLTQLQFTHLQRITLANTTSAAFRWRERNTQTLLAAKQRQHWGTDGMGLFDLFAALRSKHSAAEHVSITAGIYPCLLLV